MAWISSDSRPQALPPYLLNAWRLEPCDKNKGRNQLDGWTVTSLAKAFLEFQLQNYETAERRQDHALPPSLSSIAVGSILHALSTSRNPILDAKLVAESLSATTFKQLLTDPRLPYQTLRVLHGLPQLTAREQGQRAVDIDEVIMRNESYIRSRGRVNQDGNYLVRLADLSKLLPQSSYIQDGEVLFFVRKGLPKGGLEILDYLRAKNMQIQATDTSFSQTFGRVTNGILDGLDWNNVFMAGGMALTTLLHTVPSLDEDRGVKDTDIDLYIYGLSPEDANAKVQHIYSTWSGNLPTTARGKLVVRNTKTINLLTAYPSRRVQIVLKLLYSSTDILLNFDLDASAIGFDGSHVLMLPRFVRALETGYSVFKMDHIWGPHLGDRRSTEEACVFKYADRGFGIRFLPSYARSLGDGKVVMDRGGPVKGFESDKEFEHPHSYRYPNGNEPGLKTLKRIAYLGRDFVHRFYFGATPIAISYQQYQKQRDPSYVIQEYLQADWQKRYEKARLHVEKLDGANALLRAKRLPSAGPLMSLADLDGQNVHRELPNGRRGLGNLEVFMRHCEVWRLDAKADAILQPESLASTIYDGETYDDLPNYEWSPTFSVDQFAQDIEEANTGYWTNVKTAICKKLNIPVVLAGFGTYATRRLRRQVHGPDLDTVTKKQITVPVIIPSDLEQYILHTLPEQYPDLPSHFTETPCLIPLHDPTTHDAATSPIPSLHDTGNESGNLRYWVITNQSMWAGQHRVLDEVAELLWTLFHWLMQQTLSSQPGAPINTSNIGCVYYVARTFRRRIVLPEISEHEELGPGLPSKREATLFRPWALQIPILPDRCFLSGSGRHAIFSDVCVRYPFEDELFWKGNKEELGEEW
ncbi:MAG: hypothetical protein Q9217_004360 [Psora testacea]